MKECSKSVMRRMREPNFTNRYFVGSGLDVGGGPDPLRSEEHTSELQSH